MGTLRIYPSKENTIAGQIIPYSGYSNSGYNYLPYEQYNSSQNMVSELFYGGGESGATFSTIRRSVSRHLLYFDLADFQSKLSDFQINPNSITSYNLVMKNSIPSDEVLTTEYEFDQLAKQIAASFDLISFPIDRFWDEGRGYDLDNTRLTTKQHGNNYLKGVSNWLSATSLSLWSEPGIFTNPTASTNNWTQQHFSIGNEDIKMNVGAMVNDWLSGGSVNNGIAVAYSSYFESVSSKDRFVSSFYTNKTLYAFKPYLEIKYNDLIQDDRHQVTNNRTSRLFLYLFSGNQPINASNTAITVNILTNSNANFITGLTATQHSKGVYYVDVLMTGTTKGQRYKDVWKDISFVPGVDLQDYTQTFDIKDNYYTNNARQTQNYAVDFYGIGNNEVLNSGEKVRLYADTRIAYSTNEPFVNYGLEYRLVMGISEILPWEPMNSSIFNGCLSSWVDVDTSWLLSEQIYKLEFRITELGTKKKLENTIKFRVQNPVS